MSLIMMNRRKPRQLDMCTSSIKYTITEMEGVPWREREGGKFSQGWVPQANVLEAAGSYSDEVNHVHM